MAYHEMGAGTTRSVCIYWEGIHLPNATYEADLAVFLQLVENERDNLWAEADWALHMTATYGRKTATMLATDAGLSAAYVRQLVATAKAFPEDTRAKDISFSHHKIAAMTENPEVWLQRAVADQLSVKELQQAITDNRDRLSEAEEARRAAERLVQAAKKFNERFAQIAGQEAVLTWEPLARFGTTAATPLAARSA